MPKRGESESRIWRGQEHQTRAFTAVRPEGLMGISTDARRTDKEGEGQGESDVSCQHRKLMTWDRMGHLNNPCFRVNLIATMEEKYEQDLPGIDPIKYSANNRGNGEGGGGA